MHTFLGHQFDNCLWEFEGDRPELFLVISAFVTSLHADFGQKELNVWKFVKKILQNPKYGEIKKKLQYVGGLDGY